MNKNLQKRVKDRLSLTEDGKSLIKLVEEGGGWKAFLEKARITNATLMNWYARGCVSERGAVLLADSPVFQMEGWTREKIRPSLGDGDWPSDKKLKVERHRLTEVRKSLTKAEKHLAAARTELDTAEYALGITEAVGIPDGAAGAVQ